MDKIYIVYGYSVDCDSCYNEDIKAFFFEENARKFSDRLNSQLNELKAKLEDIQAKMNKYDIRAPERMALVDKLLKTQNDYPEVSEVLDAYDVFDLDIE